MSWGSYLVDADCIGLQTRGSSVWSGSIYSESEIQIQLSISLFSSCDPLSVALETEQNLDLGKVSEAAPPTSDAQWTEVAPAEPLQVDGYYVPEQHQ